MPPRFCANLSFLFTEKSFLDRYYLAAKAGFTAVESGFPFGFEIEEVVNAKNEAGVQQVLINIFSGDTSKGELGCAAIPGKSQEFKEALEKTIQYAKALNCKKIHVMAGKLNSEPSEDNDQVYYQNIKHASTRFEDEDILGLIEPINSVTVPRYYLNNYDRAIQVIKQVNSPNLKLMLDIFHLQHIAGNLTHNIAKLLPYVGHVQIAQVPDRNEPNSPGELDYQYVLSLLEKHGYKDWVGLEYKPKLGLSWIKEYYPDIVL